VLSVCISAEVIGAEKNLVFENDLCYLTHEIPSHSYVYSNKIKYLNDKCFDSLLKLGDVSITMDIPQKYINANSYIANNTFPKWKYILPRSTYKRALEKLLNDIKGSIELLPKSYFDVTWASGNAVLRSLKQAKTSKVEIDELLISNLHNNNAVINSFMPDDYGNCDKAIYDRFGTLTGRLSISSGPNILTLKKDLRKKIIKSRFDDGKIVMIDFTSLEPNILIRESFPEFSGDIYSEISKKLNLTRKIVKAAIIIEMYGGSKKTLIDTFDLSKDQVVALSKELEEKLKLRDLKKKLISSIDRGFLYNKYGRPIFLEENPDRIIVNYFAQSTGADISLLGYHYLCDMFSSLKEDIVPIFVLHDSIFFDVSPKFLKNVLDIQKVKIPLYDVDFAVSSKIIE
jgi:hypothetical protein